MTGSEKRTVSPMFAVAVAVSSTIKPVFTMQVKICKTEPMVDWKFEQSE